MIEYTLEDGFKFLTADNGLIVRTVSSGGLSQLESDSIFVVGSVSTQDFERESPKIFNPPRKDDYLVVRGYPLPSTVSPFKISSIQGVN
ncbi:MAG: hypothetical protein AABW82_02420 [Nanoarchaeota archaeon]